MSRKDTILIAVIINAGLLAILFATAIIYDPDPKMLEESELSSSLAEIKKPSQTASPFAISKTGDEVDNALNSYAYSGSNSYTNANPIDVFINEPSVSHQVSFQDQSEEDSSSEENFSPVSNRSFVEVTVKKGDVLEKIAKANRTTVQLIKQANQLKSERLQIGQILKIPIKTEMTSSPSLASSPSSEPIKKINEPKLTESSEVQYYVIKSGDNPWKIAKQFNVKFDDILQLNQLDEERARNLKVGDRIRVK
jgi:peptidoglycan endopeptidase LytF